VGERQILPVHTNNTPVVLPWELTKFMLH